MSENLVRLRLKFDDVFDECFQRDPVPIVTSVGSVLGSAPRWLDADVPRKDYAVAAEGGDGGWILLEFSGETRGPTNLPKRARWIPPQGDPEDYPEDDIFPLSELLENFYNFSN